ncbi:MAG: hypothetical protein EA369_02130, partial [Bradymonadales bacterium]
REAVEAVRKKLKVSERLAPREGFEPPTHPNGERVRERMRTRADSECLRVRMPIGPSTPGMVYEA